MPPFNINNGYIALHFCNSLVILFQTSQDTSEIHKPVDKNIYLSTIIHEASLNIILRARLRVAYSFGAQQYIWRTK